MGVSVSVHAGRGMTGKLQEMVELKLQCDRLEVDYPVALRQYFKSTPEVLDMDNRDEMIMTASEVCLKYGMEIEGLVNGDPEYGDGMWIDLSLLPPDITYLRIFMS